VNRDFDELVGDVTPAERVRLERVHNLLIEAGPPAEVPPEVEAGPTLAMTMGRRGPSKRHVQRRLGLLAAAVIVLLVAFLAGYITGNDSSVAGRLLKLQGTGAAPAAQGSLRIDESDPAGNWPMQLAALGLPKLKEREYYEVFLVRKNKTWLACGGFRAKNAKVGVSVRLTAPYELKPNDTWVVTRQKAGDRVPGEIVLRPTT
jgi:hypothetical protein